MLDCVDYNIDTDNHQGNGNGNNHNGYNQLKGDWFDYYQVGKNFTGKVKIEDREDFLHDCMLSMAKVKTKYDITGKPLTKGGLIRIAQYAVNDYWRRQYLLTNGIDCGRCSKKQRQQCKEKDLYRQCPKAVKTESLNGLVEDSEGTKTELYQMIADDKAIDIVAMMDAKHILNSYPRRFIQLAYKRRAGFPLTNTEKSYYYQKVKRVQKTLI